MTEALQRIAHFDFGEQTEDVALATSGLVLDFSSTMPLTVVPGMNVRIPLKMRDKLNNTAPSVY